MAIANATAIERGELLELARGFARRELMPRAAPLDAGDPDVIATCWRQLAERGLDRALLPEEHRGGELDVASFLAVVEELSVGDGGIALCVLLSNVALRAVTPELLATIPAGARWVAVPGGPGTEVTDSGTTLSGRISCALGAYDADGLVLIGGARENAIPADTPGLKLQRDETQMGLRAAPMAQITLDGVAAAQPELTADGAGLVLLRAGMAAIARGIARRAHEMALDYARERHQGGVAIIGHDAVSDMLAAMAVRLTLPLQAPTSAREALAAKIAFTDAAVATTIDAVQVFGGAGYMRETGIEKLMRDAMYGQLFAESNWVAQDELMQDERAQALRPPSTVSSAPVT